MRISSLELGDFRNHANLALTFEAGATTIIGRNGRGKTNIVEAINFLATLGSHRVSSDFPLLRHGTTQAKILATVHKDDRAAQVEIEINDGKQNRVILNGGPLSRPRDILGLVHTVVFAPEDLALVKGDPGDRRKYLDEFATQMSPRVAAVRSDFDKVLKQRNALLKSAGRRALSDSAKQTLDVWNDQFVSHAVSLTTARLEALSSLRPFIESHGDAISGNTEELRATYSSKWLTHVEEDLETQLRDALAHRQQDEIDRGLTLVGPHRDDIDIELAGLPAKNFASHGQSWSIALALRLATFDVLRSHHDDPILILDDVFAELDVRRRERLIASLQGVEQTLVTAAVAEDVPTFLLDQTLVLAD